MRATKVIQASWLAILLASAATGAAAAPKAALAWREAFQSSPVGTDFNTDADFDAFAQRLHIPPPVVAKIRPRHVQGTLRYRLVVSAGGSQLQIRISNELGKSPLRLAHASVGLAGTEFEAVQGSVRPVTFGGSPGVVIAPGTPALSDPIDLAVAAGGSLLVSLNTPDDFVVGGGGGGAPAAIAPGDQTSAEKLASADTVGARPLVSAISVRSPISTKVVVALGDSITDGNRPQIGALHAWPEELARRLSANGPAGRDGQTGNAGHAIVNAGISGNMVLKPAMVAEMGVSALARLDRDALRIDGLTHIIVLEGTNDIGTSGPSPMGNNPRLSPGELIAGYRQILARAHARGVKVIFGTITPVGGSMSHSSPDKEALRKAVNQWIRTSGEPDGIVDFDAATRDPANPEKLLPAFDSGDHLHPNEAGQKAMGDAVDLALFK